jgi:hypothetical protein
VDGEPSDEELRAFAGSMLSNLDRQLREPEVIDEAWVALYRASSGFDVPDSQRH